MDSVSMAIDYSIRFDSTRCVAKNESSRRIGETRPRDDVVKGVDESQNVAFEKKEVDASRHAKPYLDIGVCLGSPLFQSGSSTSSRPEAACIGEERIIITYIRE